MSVLRGILFNRVPQLTITQGPLTLLRGQLLLPDGTAPAPALAFTNQLNAGLSMSGGAGIVDMSVAGAVQMRWRNGNIDLAAALRFGASVNSIDLVLAREAPNTLVQRNGAAAQVYRLYNAYTDASNNERLELDWMTQPGIAMIVTNKSGTGTHRALDIGTRGVAPLMFRTADSVRWIIDTDGVYGPNVDGQLALGRASGSNRPGAIFLTSPAITVGSGAGLTVVNVGEVRRLTYKVTVTYAALAAAALTADKTIATLPAKTRLVSIVADTTVPYTGGGVTAATLVVGKSVGGNEYLVSHDVLSAAVTKGNADADLGTAINRANAVQGGDLPSWSGTTIVSVRLTTVTANTAQLTAGSTTYYLTTEVMP